MDVVSGWNVEVPFRKRGLNQKCCFDSESSAVVVLSSSRHAALGQDGRLVDSRSPESNLPRNQRTTESKEPEEGTRGRNQRKEPEEGTRETQHQQESTTCEDLDDWTSDKPPAVCHSHSLCQDEPVDEHVDEPVDEQLDEHVDEPVDEPVDSSDSFVIRCGLFVSYRSSSSNE
ncbi:hypothetical protein F2P81_024635 [Scophthalmus maximus]|uniref:Uncharacterized protein n=1 Tax=Scophthalmus maximus TaxID=52904 RepID=A0A6A4RUV6_SCOMX|nr:hypothetical protein F2P81_024635 [Scophthalmus maximus]